MAADYGVLKLKQTKVVLLGRERGRHAFVFKLVVRDRDYYHRHAMKIPYFDGFGRTGRR